MIGHDQRKGLMQNAIRKGRRCRRVHWLRGHSFSATPRRGAPLGSIGFQPVFSSGPAVAILGPSRGFSRGVGRGSARAGELGIARNRGRLWFGDRTISARKEFLTRPSHSVCVFLGLATGPKPALRLSWAFLTSRPRRKKWRNFRSPLRRNPHAFNASRTAGSFCADPSFSFLCAINLAYSSTKILPGGRRSN